MAGGRVGATVTGRVRMWQQRLEAVVAERRDMPFEYGTHDCITFAAACVEACTGRTVREIHDHYTGERDGLRLLQMHGGLRALAAARLGEQISPRLAAPGDVGLYDEAGRPALAVNVGGAWLAPAARGLVPLKPGAVVIAWRCERG